MTVFLVRPHPPAEILAGACPIPEEYKYNWQPMALKYIAYQLKERFGQDLQIKIWHLMSYEDDELFTEALKAQAPALVAFSEIDVLVGEVNRWAVLIKKLLPETWTLVGGKQTSLLAPGDKFPFKDIDYALRGDSIPSLLRLVAARMEGTQPENCPAVLRLDGEGRVLGPTGYDPRTEITALDGIALQALHIENHPFPEYLEKHQAHPALIPGPIRTASLLGGIGCPHQCVFCQSPIEYGEESRSVRIRPPENLAEEIAWLVKENGVNNIFSLEANLNLNNWLRTYECLERHDIDSLAISGFVRAADVLEAYRQGILGKLAEKGMRVLSVGLDIPLDSEKDIYNKAFTRETLMSCLEVCEAQGILLSATFVGDPSYTCEEFQGQLRALKELPVAAVDIRLAIALRNTDFYKRMSPWLLYRPEENRRYFSRQNYRYQTLQLPGKITPAQTYRSVRSFKTQFLLSDEHLNYVLRFLRRFPESAPFFLRQYKPVFENRKSCPEKLRTLAEALNIPGVCS